MDFGIPSGTCLIVLHHRNCPTTFHLLDMFLLKSKMLYGSACSAWPTSLPDWTTPGKSRRCEMCAIGWGKPGNQCCADIQNSGSFAAAQCLATACHKKITTQCTHIDGEQAETLRGIDQAHDAAFLRQPAHRCNGLDRASRIRQMRDRDQSGARCHQGGQGKRLKQAMRVGNDGANQDASGLL